VPGVLTTTSIITCATEGKVTPVSAAGLKVDGKPVLLQNQVSTWTVAGCKKNTPCATVAAPTAGVSTKLKVKGTPVLLANLAAQGSSGDPVKATGVQTKLTAS
jgi:hypothetical protein